MRTRQGFQSVARAAAYWRIVMSTIGERMVVSESSKKGC
jgi:hypothetical protein